MNTLQERLRDLEWHEHSADEQRSRRYEAADALDAKDARIKELEGALREIARGMRGGQIMYASECWAIAREAIK